jgi:EAL domain-containing protein (putative c-di-GMP-specific phosphodiesterase class I)
MVKSISEIGQMMEKKIVAEYVEHADLIEPLKACGIDYLQGNAIDSPMPIDELLHLPTAQLLAS